MLRSIRNRFGILLILPILALFAACDDDPLEPDEHVDEATGIVIRDLQGNLIAETHEGHWDIESANQAHGGALRLDEGEDLEVRIFFQAADGDEFQLANDDDHQLVVTFNPEGFVEYHAHGDHGDLEALQVGQTQATFYLWHGNFPSGHADFSTEDNILNIEVEAAGS